MAAQEEGGAASGAFEDEDTLIGGERTGWCVVPACGGSLSVPRECNTCCPLLSYSLLFPHPLILLASPFSNWAICFPVGSHSLGYTWEGAYRKTWDVDIAVTDVDALAKFDLERYL
jgi:hypothetical protein